MTSICVSCEAALSMRGTPICGHHKATGPNSDAFGVRPNFALDIGVGILAVGDRPTPSDYPAVEILGTQKTRGNTSLVTIFATRLTSDHCSTDVVR